MKRVLGIVLVLAVLAAVGGVLFVRSARDTQTSVDAKTASKLAGAAASTTSIDPGMRPDAGVYEYVGGGSEHITLLGGSTHEFPENVNAIVQLDPSEACAWQLDLVLVKEHTEQRRYCTGETGTRDAGFERTTNFLGHEQTSAYECDAKAMRMRVGAKPGASWSWTCKEARGGLVKFTATYVGDEQLTIGDDTFSAAHIKLVGTQRDKSTGNERGDWWLAPTGLPVRIHSDRDIIATAGPLGNMTTTEKFQYELVSLKPGEIPAD